MPLNGGQRRKEKEKNLAGRSFSKLRMCIVDVAGQKVPQTM